MGCDAWKGGRVTRQDNAKPTGMTTIEISMRRGAAGRRPGRRR